jgi:hypothetical protein
MHGDLNRAAFAVNNNRVFRSDALFIRTENVVGARSAQVSQKPARTENRPRGSPIAHG